MYTFEGDFLLLDDTNEMLPRKNLIVTLICCFFFYNLLVCDIFLIEKNIALKILQIAVWIVNATSLFLILQKDPGVASNRSRNSKNSINFYDENVIYNRNMLHMSRLDLFNDDDFCEKCSIHKKGTISHCRFCDVCIKKRDHHCAWFNRCIAENNLCQFRNFLISSMFSALILVLDMLKIFTTGELVGAKVFDLLLVFIVLFACTALFVLTGLLTIQYLIAAILGIETRKLVSGRWKWKSTRLFRWMKKEKVTIQNFEEC